MVSEQTQCIFCSCNFPGSLTVTSRVFVVVVLQSNDWRTFSWLHFFGFHEIDSNVVHTLRNGVPCTLLRFPRFSFLSETSCFLFVIFSDFSIRFQPCLSKTCGPFAQQHTKLADEKLAVQNGICDRRGGAGSVRITISQNGQYSDVHIPFVSTPIEAIHESFFSIF